MARIRVRAPRKSICRSLVRVCVVVGVVVEGGGRWRTRWTIREARKVRGNWIMNALVGGCVSGIVLGGMGIGGEG